MAQGDAKNFNVFVNKLTRGEYNEADVLSLAFVSDEYGSVSSNDATPTLSDLTVVSGGNVSASYTLQNVTYNRVDEDTFIACDNLATIEKDPSNPSPLCAVVYNDTSTNDELYKIYDLTTDGTTGLDLVNNDFNLSFENNTLITVTNASL